MRCFLLSLFFCATAPAATITGIKMPEGIRAELEAYQSGNDIYIKTGSLAKFLDGTETVNAIAKIGKIDFGSFSIEYGLFSRFIKSGDDIYSLYRPVIYREGSFFLPIRYLAAILNKVSNAEFAWDGRNFQVSPPSYNVTGISASQKMNGLLIDIYMKESLKFGAVRNIDNWLVVTVEGARIDSLAFTRRLPVRAIYEVKTYQFDNSAQVSIKLRPRDFTFTSKLKDDPLRIQILVRGEGFSDSTMIADELSAREPLSENPIDVIVIDPGHGGEDRGAVGAKGAIEKEIVLKIAEHLYTLLKDDGRFTPIMTRQDDIFVPLSQRAALANSVGGDMFISIHANASRNKKAEGVIAFSLADARTDQARATASLENSSIRFENIEEQKRYKTDLDFTLRDMMQSEYQRESVDLADIMQKTVSRAAGIDSRGVDQAGFFVLDKAYMPAVLFESGFLTNLRDERQLMKVDFQKRTARAIYDSIVAFKEKYEAEKRSSE
jgi:N-acetylmuramoyl-L-alanine amidase